MSSGPAAELAQHARAAIMSADVQLNCNCWPPATLGAQPPTSWEAVIGDPCKDAKLLENSILSASSASLSLSSESPLNKTGYRRERH